MSTPRCRGMRRRSNPRVCSHFRRGSDNVARNCCTSAGGTGHPSAGVVAGQQNRCCSVPTALWHSWQDGSSICQRGTAALRACGHCPPTTAEASSPRHAGDQSVVWRAPDPLPWISGCRIEAKSTTIESLKCNASGTSHVSGRRPGSSAAMRLTRHRRTARCPARTIAAGESHPNFQTMPRSSVTSWALPILQPSRRTESIRPSCSASSSGC